MRMGLREISLGGGEVRRELKTWDVPLSHLLSPSVLLAWS